jgi:hypothetical protein
MYFKGGAMAMLLLFGSRAFVLAQHPTHAMDSLSKHDSLGATLHKYGMFEGHFRSYSMSTINHGHARDYFAQGVGGGLAYYSPIIKRFQVGLSGFIIYNVHSSSLEIEDGYANRYELALFDITDPANHEDLDRLENLYLRYYLRKHDLSSFIQIGKFQLNTPLLNMQDSRMRPNLQEGLWSEFTLSKSVQFKGGWLWETSPRSTIHWYGVGESIGIYGNGKAVDGSAAKYHGHVKSNGIGIGHMQWSPKEKFTYQFWNYYTHNLFNLVLQKFEVKRNLNSSTIVAGVQHLWQHSISKENIELSSQYIGPKEKSHVLSFRLSISTSIKKNSWTLNYTRITSHGRFLFPREWGTETLYTYISRERNEGSGNVHAWMIENTRFFGRRNNLAVQALAGVYKMPSFDNYRLNKYSVPSYYHLALKGRYKFDGFLYGLEAQVLYVYKGTLEEPPADAALTHNKVKMHHAALVLDYHF